jgi:hypothetical protein
MKYMTIGKPYKLIYYGKVKIKREDITRIR